MSKGVNFTPATADRIEAAVQTVERSAPPGTSTQRQRAGGLGRSTLWEVTEVQTTPKTVTLQRVDNPDMELNTVRDREDIYYDPGAAPSVGDRGLVIRLGDGSLFFFKRAAGLDNLLMTDYAYVKDDDVNVTFGYPNVLEAQYHDVGGSITNQIGIGKFASVAAGDYTSLILPNAFMVAGATATGGVALPKLFIDVKLWKITEDFDISAVTFTSWSALAKTAVGVAQIVLESGQIGTVTYANEGSVSGITANASGLKRSVIGFQVPWGGSTPAPIDLDGAVGIGIEMVKTIQVGTNADGFLTAAKTTAGGATYIGYATKHGL